jgi:hypothetical protein
MMPMAAAAPAGTPGRRVLTREQAPPRRRQPNPREIPMTQAILLHALAVHILAGGVPNPAPAAPPGLAGPMNTILSWGKWSVLICGVAGVLICGGKMALGHLTRSSNLAADAATHLPVVFLGLSLVAISAGVVGVFL